jgi:glycosyltransferase involved in cell wall biosynthesis
MKIHGICLLKNEADIVEYSLLQNSRWCDVIYVYDNASTDGTMERVKALAQQHRHIIPFGTSSRPFADNLRADVFNYFKSQAAPDDWWCRLDADEIHVDDVRAFLARVPRHLHLVWSIYLQYYLTEKDLPRLEPFEGQPPFDVNAENLPRHYLADYAEPKYFRHRPGLRWNVGSWPDHVGLAAPGMLRHQHFQYRSPAQIERRLATRREAGAQGWPGFPHSSEIGWREKIRSSAELHFDAGDGRYIVKEARLPCPLEPGWQRLVKRLLHGSGFWP